LDYTQTNWIQLLPKAQFAMNDAYNSVTEITPNEAVFGKKGENMKPKYKAINQDIQWKRESMKKAYDKRRKDAPTLKERDKFYLRRRNFGQKKFHLKTRRSSGKLNNLKLGSFRIEKKLDYDNYRLKLPEAMKIHPEFHVSRLEKTENPANDENTQVMEETWDVEWILDKRVNN
jgi:hypothetical protein